MIYGDDVSHVVTEEGIAYLYMAEGQEERRRALAAVAGVSPSWSEGCCFGNCGASEEGSGRISGRYRGSPSGSETLSASGSKYGRSSRLVRGSL
jgi:hypothetical protein